MQRLCILHAIRHGSLKSRPRSMHLPVIIDKSAPRAGPSQGRAVCAAACNDEITYPNFAAAPSGIRRALVYLRAAPRESREKVNWSFSVLRPRMLLSDRSELVREIYPCAFQFLQLRPRILVGPLSFSPSLSLSPSLWNIRINSLPAVMIATRPVIDPMALIRLISVYYPNY